MKQRSNPRILLRGKFCSFETDRERHTHTSVSVCVKKGKTFKGTMLSGFCKVLSRGTCALLVISNIRFYPKYFVSKRTFFGLLFNLREVNNKPVH